MKVNGSSSMFTMDQVIACTFQINGSGGTVNVLRETGVDADHSRPSAWSSSGPVRVSGIRTQSSVSGSGGGWSRSTSSGPLLRTLFTSGGTG